MVLIPNAYSMDIMLYNIIGQMLLFIPLILICLMAAKESPKNILMINKISFLDVILSILLAIAIEPAMTLLSILSTLIFPNDISEYLYQAIDSPLIYSVLAVAVIPAIFEELFFRGIIFSQLKNLSLKKASIIAGLLFGLGHFNPQQFLYAFAMGTLACVVVYITKSIFPTMILHFTINFSQLMLSRIDYSELPEDLSTTIGEAASVSNMSISQIILPYIVLTVISIPIIALIIMLMGGKYGRVTTKKTNTVLLAEGYPIVEDETIFDYNPEKEYEERIFTVLFFIIIICYLAFISLTILIE